MASLKVAVRVRPFNRREHEMGSKLIVQMDGKKTRLLKPENGIFGSISTPNRDSFHDFTFDYSYWSFGDHCENDHNNMQHIYTQDEVYNDLGTDVINCAFEGYNACLFAYGQTGSGKTFTMMGTQELPGLIPRICKEMFNRTQLGQKSGIGYKTNVSYLEIYNERVKDLLGEKNAGDCILRVREHRQTGPYVEGLSQHPVSDYSEIQEFIDHGNMFRTTASTKMNDASSRSHAILTITFVQATFLDGMPSETVSKIHLVDLAGSERANATEATGDRLKEGAHINKSLVSLGSVISALAEQSIQATQKSNRKKKTFIPYRDSILTWLLKDSLGGNSKTIMIAAISPADCNYSETLSTLRYANRAKNIINTPTINEDPNVKLIKELREEIMKLKGMLSSTDNNNSSMLEDLMKKEAQEKFLTEEWAEKWRQTQSILREEKTLGLRKSGFGVVLDSDAPHLIGILDGNTTGVTLYSLKEGETIIGNEDNIDDSIDEYRKVDIVLTGNGIKSLHCLIKLTDGTATIYPYAGAQCWLNANLVTSSQVISQGDILLFGRTNMFRYCNPVEAAKLQKSESENQSKPDLSRLSLIAASRENLIDSVQCIVSDDESSHDLSKSIHGQQQSNSESVQKEHRKILETIEHELHKLNSLHHDKCDMDSMDEWYNKLIVIIEQLSCSEQNDLQEKLLQKNKNKDIDQVEEREKEDALNDNIKPNKLQSQDANFKVDNQSNERLVEGEGSNEDLNVNGKHIDITTTIKTQLESNIDITPEQMHPTDTPQSENATADLLNSEDNLSQYAMQILHHNIIAQKNHIMKNLGLKNNAQLNEDITKLQLLQKQYLQYERENMKNCGFDYSDTNLGTHRPNEPDQHSADSIDVKSSITHSSYQCDSYISRPRSTNDYDPEYVISIPSYQCRGTGKQTHFEYEIRITLCDDKWVIMRRYSRFRELHLCVKALYGEKVSQIPFPSRELFASKSESVARNRRRHLETYIRRLIVVCSKIPQCPFYEGANGFGLNKATLVEFSQFFRKGLFENGKYGTG